MVTCEGNSEVTHNHGCGGEGVNMRFSPLMTSQKQMELFEGLEHDRILQGNRALCHSGSPDRGFDSLRIE